MASVFTWLRPVILEVYFCFPGYCLFLACDLNVGVFVET